MTQPIVLIPIPSLDFDPTEVAVTWKHLHDAGMDVRFATPDGQPAQADTLMLTGEGLDFWSALPLLKPLKLLGLALRANADARAAHAAMQKDPRFLNPQGYASLSPDTFDGLVLPGGHRARGMKPYLEHPGLQRFVGEFFDSGKPVGAVCHGVVLAARSLSPRTGKSVLHGRKTVALTWKMEHTASSLMKFCGRFWDASYYRTYVEAASEPAGYRSVQAEVIRALASPADFVDVPADAEHFFRKSSGLFRDSADDTRPSWVVRDGNYVSARWPGDVHAFAATFAGMVMQAKGRDGQQGDPASA